MILAILLVSMARTAQWDTRVEYRGKHIAIWESALVSASQFRLNTVSIIPHRTLHVTFAFGGASGFFRRPTISWRRLLTSPFYCFFFYRCSFNGLRVRFYGSLSWWQRAISPLSTDFCPTGTVLSFFRTNGSRARHLSILTTLLSDFDSSQSFSSRFRGAFGRYMTYVPPSRPRPRRPSDSAKPKSRPIHNAGHRCRTRWKTR